MPEKINWDDSNFTKMVNEYGDKIAKISDNESKVLLEQLLNSEEVNLFTKNIDKKKLKNKDIENNSAALGASFADAPKVLLAGIDDDTETNNETDNENKKDAQVIDESFEDTNLKYNIPYENIRPYEKKIKAIAEKVGKNFQDIAINFITKGPGLTDLNLFEGIVNTIKEPVDTDFAKLINDFYNKNTVFNKAYDGLMYALGSEPDNINTTLKKIVDNILQAEGYEDKADAKSISIFRLILQLVTVVLHNNYNAIKQEFTKTTKNSKIADALYVFYNEIIAIKQANGTLGQKPSIKELTTIINGPYKKCLETPGVGNNNPIGILFYIISSAKASGYIEDKFIQHNDNDISGKNKNILSFEKVYNVFKKAINKIDKTVIDLKYDELLPLHQSFLQQKIKNKNKDALKQTVIRLKISFSNSEINIVHSDAKFDKFNFYITSSDWDNSISKEKTTNPTAFAAINEAVNNKDFKKFISILIQYKPFIDNVKKFEVKK